MPEPATTANILAAYHDILNRTPNAKLLLVTQVSNKTGLVTPVKEIVAMACERGVDTIVDAAHGIACLDFHFAVGAAAKEAHLRGLRDRWVHTLSRMKVILNCKLNDVDMSSRLRRSHEPHRRLAEMLAEAGDEGTHLDTLLHRSIPLDWMDRSGIIIDARANGSDIGLDATGLRRDRDSRSGSPGLPTKDRLGFRSRSSRSYPNKRYICASY